MKSSILFYLMCIPNKIKNYNVPPCKNCINFMDSSSYEYGKCKLFGEKNIITDEVSNDFANSCRSSENKCGIEGKYFEEVNFITKFYRYIKPRGIYLYLTLIVLSTILSAWLQITLK